MLSRVRPGGLPIHVLGAMGRESSRGARPSTRGVGPRKDPIKSSKHSPILNPNGGGDGAGNTVGNIDLTKVKGNVCLTCGARARSVVVGEGRCTRHERSGAIILVEVTRFAMGGGAPANTSISRDAWRAIWGGSWDLTHPCGKFHHVRGEGSDTTWWGGESRSGARIERKGERLP